MFSKNIITLFIAVYPVAALATKAYAEILTEPTEKVVGFKPVAANVKLFPTIPQAGTEVKVMWEYQDKDGDEENGSTVQWLLNGEVIEEGEKFTTPKDSAGSTLQVRVTPKSAPPADPAIGDMTTSPLITISELDVIAPTLKLYTQVQADQHCKSLNARLPTEYELENIYLKHTSATDLGKDMNMEMCQIHGWPLKNCGGGGKSVAFNLYWTNNFGPKFPVVVDMTSGTALNAASDNMSFAVSCIRN